MFLASGAGYLTYGRYDIPNLSSRLTSVAIIFGILCYCDFANMRLCLDRVPTVPTTIFIKIKFVEIAHEAILRF